MAGLSLHTSAAAGEPPDPSQEIARLEALLAARRAELAALRDEFHAFKARYTQVVGRPLAELAELEREIAAAERRALGVEPAADDAPAQAAAVPTPRKTSLRKLFWSVARLFHPDMAADEREARRRHAIMVEASRAYREGDVESLHTLLGDEQLQSYCAAPAGADDEGDLNVRLVNLKEELRTVEFGIRRIKQDGLFRVKLATDAATARGHDALADTAASIERQIVKARHRLAHLS